MPITQIIKLDNLIVNKENYRFDKQKNEDNAIDIMAENQKNNLYNLAEDIAKKGFNPLENIAVYKKSNKYIVLEGNRRIISLKFLFNPNLIKDNKLKNKFQELYNRYKNNISSNVECLVASDEKEIKYWIGLKHGFGKEGITTETWGTEAKSRYEGKNIISIELIEFLKNDENSSNVIKSMNIKKIPKITTLQRIFDNDEIMKILGIDSENGELKLKNKEAIPIIERIIKDISIDKTESSRTLNTNNEKLNYINRISKEIKSTNKIKQIENPIKEISLNQKTLIPSSCKIRIKPNRINNIYHELKKIKITEYKNSISVLLRVFIELSADYFIEKKDLFKNVPEDKKYNINLKSKIRAILNELKKNVKYKLSDESSVYINKCLDNKDSLLNISTWHSYIHNKSFNPITCDLIDIWSNIQDFMEKLWLNIEE